MQRTKKLEENKIKTMHKGSKIKTLLSLPIHLSHHRSTVKPLLLLCRTNIATLSLCCCSAVAPLSHRYRSAVTTPLLLRCRAAVTPLLHRYRYAAVAPAVNTQSHRYRTSIAPLSPRCYRSCCLYAVTPLSHRYCSTVAPLLLLLLLLRNPPVSNRCRAVVEP